MSIPTLITAAGSAALAVCLALYAVAARRRRASLPELPLGALVAYFAGRAAFAVVESRLAGASWLHWVEVGLQILLACGIVRLAFALAVELPLKARGREPLPKITRDFILLIGYAAIAVVLLHRLGNFNLAGLITTSAVLTAVIGLASQSTLTSLLSGLVLQFDRPFTIGEWINYDGNVGRVVSISWKSTRLVTLENHMIDIPNQLISTSKFINYSRPGGGYWARFTLGLDYTAAPGHVRETLLAVLAHHPRIERNPPPEVRLVQFGDFAVSYEIRFWNRDFALERRTVAELQDQIWYALKRAGIRIPFPIREVQYAHRERIEARRTEAERRRAVGALLAANPVLAVLSEAERAALAERLRVADYGAGEFVVRKGDAGDSMYIITAGACEVLAEAADGAPRLVATLGPGDGFGEMSLLTGAARSAGVRATRDTSLAVIDKAAFSEFLTARPEAAALLAGILEQRQAQLAQAFGASAPAAHAGSSGILGKIRAFFGLRGA